MPTLSSARCLALALLLPPSAQDPQAPDLLPPKAKDAFLARVEQAMAPVRTVVAELEQEQHLALLEETVTARGLILFAAPDRLRWEIREPFHSLLVVRGDRVAKFEWIGAERQRLELGKAHDVVLLVMDRIRSWFRGRFDRNDKVYRLEAAEQPSPLLLLQPIDPALRQGLESIELWLAKDLASVERVVLREAGGDYTILRFSPLPGQHELPDAWFDPADPGPLDLERLRQPPAKDRDGSSGESKR